MKITFLGTNGWYDTKTGNTICTLIETSKFNIILDAGNGIYKADRYIDRKKPVLMFLSHFHVDHIEGLHILDKFNPLFRSLTIIGQPGTKKNINNIMRDPYTLPLKHLDFDTKIIELNEGWHNSPIRFQCRKLIHKSSCFGYRLEIDGKVISYCTDTGYCKQVIELSQNADVMISECAYAPGQTNPKWPHLNPETAAKMAKESHAKKLVLTHFDAAVYTTASKRENAKIHAKKIFNNTIIANDDMRLLV